MLLTPATTPTTQTTPTPGSAPKATKPTAKPIMTHGAACTPGTSTQDKRSKNHGLVH